MSTSETVTLVDAKGTEAVTTISLHDFGGSDRMILVGGALYTRHGVDGSGRKRFVFERTQRA